MLWRVYRDRKPQIFPDSATVWTYPGSHQEQVILYVVDTSADNASGNAREDVSVVTLARVVLLSFVFNHIEGRTRGKHS